MTANDELIARVRDENVCTDVLHHELANALEAATSAPVEATERERIAALIMDSPETEFYRQENATPWKTALRIADSILAGFRAPAVDGEWEYGIRADGDDEPYSDYSDDLDWLTDGFSFEPGDRIVKRRKAGPWVPVESEEGAEQ